MDQICEESADQEQAASDHDFQDAEEFGDDGTQEADDIEQGDDAANDDDNQDLQDFGNSFHCYFEEVAIHRPWAKVHRTSQDD